MENDLNAGPESVPSPCIKLCRLAQIDPCGGPEWCLGCLRTMDEIIAWPHADTAMRHEIRRRIASRRALVD